MSLALHLVLNVLIRAFPGTSADGRAREVFGEYQSRADEMRSTTDSSRVRVFFPWKQMLLWSMGLTVLANVIRLLN